MNFRSGLPTRIFTLRPLPATPLLCPPCRVLDVTNKKVAIREDRHPIPLPFKPGPAFAFTKPGVDSGARRERQKLSLVDSITTLAVSFSDTRVFLVRT